MNINTVDKALGVFKLKVAYIPGRCAVMLTDIASGTEFSFQCEASAYEQIAKFRNDDGNITLEVTRFSDGTIRISPKKEPDPNTEYVDLRLLMAIDF